MLRLNHEIFNFSTRVDARLPAAENASLMPNSESVVGAVEVKAYDGLKNVLAEYACTMSDESVQMLGNVERAYAHCLVSMSQHLTRPS